MRRVTFALGTLLTLGALGCGDSNKGATTPTEMIPIIQGGPKGAGGPVQPGPQEKNPGGKQPKNTPPNSGTVD